MNAELRKILNKLTPDDRHHLIAEAGIKSMAALRRQAIFVRTDSSEFPCWTCKHIFKQLKEV